jgi:ABC-type multidrug transport system fused ATPase/permease subunit
MAITSASVFAAMFFKTAQLSGVYAAIGFLVVSVVGQIIDHGSPTSGEVAILSLLFPGMDYMFMMGYIGRYEQQKLPTNLIRAATATPLVSSTSRVNGILLLVFLVIQIFIYPVLAILVETWIHGARSKHRTLGVGSSDESSSATIRISELTKIYPRTVLQKWFARGKSKDFVAVDHLSFTAERGQILCLLGANGSGKTTTLDMIGGLQDMSSGSIHINAKRSQLGEFLRGVFVSILANDVEASVRREMCYGTNLPWKSMSVSGMKSSAQVTRSWPAITSLKHAICCRRSRLPVAP